MQYELQKLERMSIDEVREIAVSMGLNPRRSQSVREISYAILDAQADQRAAVVQAKEEARAATGTPNKRERKRGVKAAAQKVEVKAKNDHVATVGTEKEQMAQMQEQIEFRKIYWGNVKAFKSRIHFCYRGMENIFINNVSQGCCY